MNNFYLRVLSSIILAPIFLFSVYKNGFFFYLILSLILFTGFNEIYRNIFNFFLKLFLYLLILLFIYSVVIIRSDTHNGFIYFIWVLFVVWLSDIGGYCFGKIFKGPGFSKYSPNKTISGLIGSLLLSQFSIIVLFLQIDNFKFNFGYLFIQLLICLSCIAGDIFFSYIKRINNIKDFSNIIPGHGGILDRIDGMIFSFIFYYFISLSHVF